MIRSDANDPRRNDDPVWRERLTAYLDGELSPAEAREVLAWLEAHPTALRELEEDRRVWALLAAYRDEAVPAGFAERVVERVMGKAGASSAARVVDASAPHLTFLSGGRARRYAALAATVVLAVGVGAFAANRLAGPPESVPSTVSPLDAVPAALLESDDVVTKLASLSDDEFEALLHDDPERLAQATK